MKIQKIKAWINVKCCECGKIIYPNFMVKIRPERIESKFAEWKCCEECFNKLFTEEFKKKVK